MNAVPLKKKPIQIDGGAHLRNVLTHNSGKLVVCNWTTYWCECCRQIEKELTQFCQDNEDLVCVNIEATDNETLVGQAGIHVYPTFTFFFNGEKLTDYSFGGASVPKLKSTVQLIRENVVRPALVKAEKEEKSQTESQNNDQSPVISLDAPLMDLKQALHQLKRTSAPERFLQFIKYFMELFQRIGAFPEKHDLRVIFLDSEPFRTIVSGMDCLLFVMQEFGFKFQVIQRRQCYIMPEEVISSGSCQRNLMLLHKMISDGSMDMPEQNHIVDPERIAQTATTPLFQALYQSFEGKAPQIIVSLLNTVASPDAQAPLLASLLGENDSVTRKALQTTLAAATSFLTNSILQVQMSTLNMNQQQQQQQNGQSQQNSQQRPQGQIPQQQQQQQQQQNSIVRQSSPSPPSESQSPQQSPLSQQQQQQRQQQQESSSME
eukprot:TRINITY_DN86_c0_g1_i1.p1 TRINITY_DN86_c0_g1~~TRINITY_DN86_c0_g1_i1.p1  ORF type:complete len:433 (+),score=143.26 TRINITY_DN86_c0_g1_i1:202-1500(+)